MIKRGIANCSLKTNTFFWCPLSCVICSQTEDKGPLLLGNHFYSYIRARELFIWSIRRFSAWRNRKKCTHFASSHKFIMIWKTFHLYYCASFTVWKCSKAWSSFIFFCSYFEVSIETYDTAPVKKKIGVKG